MDENIKEAMLREKEKSLRISRIPKRIKENFLKLADKEFEGDYGMTLKYLWDCFERETTFMENFDIKLNYLVRLSEKDKNEENGSGPKTLSGKVLEGGIKKNE